MDSSGTSTLFGSADNYARRLYSEFRAAGFAATIGAAPNAEAALMLARSGAKVICADRDSVRGKLARLSTSLLPCEAKTRAVLSRWDIRTLGELAAGPKIATRTLCEILLIEGAFQNVDKVIHIRAKHIEELDVTSAPMESHDFHQEAAVTEPMTSPHHKQPPKDWWLENACRIAAFRLGQHRYMSANTVPIREQVRDASSSSASSGRRSNDTSGRGSNAEVQPG